MLASERLAIMENFPNPPEPSMMKKPTRQRSVSLHEETPRGVNFDFEEDADDFDAQLLTAANLAKASAPRRLRMETEWLGAKGPNRNARPSYEIDPLTGKKSTQSLPHHRRGASSGGISVISEAMSDLTGISTAFDDSQCNLAAAISQCTHFKIEVSGMQAHENLTLVHRKDTPSYRNISGKSHGMIYQRGASPQSSVLTTPYGIPTVTLTMMDSSFQPLNRPLVLRMKEGDHVESGFTGSHTGILERRLGLPGSIIVCKTTVLDGAINTKVVSPNPHFRRWSGGKNGGHLHSMVTVEVSIEYKVNMHDFDIMAWSGIPEVETKRLRHQDTAPAQLETCLEDESVISRIRSMQAA